MNALISPYINQFLVLEPLDLFAYTKSEKSNFFPFSAVDLTSQLKRFCDQFSPFKPFMQVYTTAQTFIVGMLSPAGDAGEEIHSSFVVIERNSTDSEEEIKRILAAINEYTTSLNEEAHSLEAQEEIRSKKEQLEKKLKELLEKTSGSISPAPELSGGDVSSSFMGIFRAILSTIAHKSSESEQQTYRVFSEVYATFQIDIHTKKEQLEKKLKELLATSSDDSEQKIKQILCALDNIIYYEKFNELLKTKFSSEKKHSEEKAEFECLREKRLKAESECRSEGLADLDYEMVIKQISLNIGEKWISKYNAEIEALLNSLEGVDIEQKANEEDGETADSFQQDMHFNAQENLLTFQRVLNAAEFKADELFQVVLDLMDQNIPYDILIETLLILLPKLDIHLTDQLLLQILKKAIIKKDLRLLDFFIARYIKNDSLFNAYVKCGLLAEALKHDVFDHLVTLPDK